MSIPYPSFEHLALIRDDVRRLASRAADHALELETAVRNAETDLRQADAELSHVLAGVERTEAEVQRLLSASVKRATARTAAARHACVSAREQQFTSERLVRHLDADAPAEPQTTSRGVTVLVVDDGDDVREMVAFVLRDAGFVVRTAVNGLEALLGAYEMPPAVIVMDMTMPVLDGLEATRLLKATKATRDARVIAYTGNPPLADSPVHRLFAAVLPKPSTPDVLLAAVQSAAHG
jgi:CheY-like chemotaxis protein